MQAMILRRLVLLDDEPAPLEWGAWPDPEPGPDQVTLRIRAVGVCRTDLDIIEGRTAPPELPCILGHQVVGVVDGVGTGVTAVRTGQRVGVAWIGSACGACEWCRAGFENLCPSFGATGRDLPGGYAERMVARAAFVHPLPDSLDDLAAAPLLCAGAIGYRSLRLSGLVDGQRLGLTGFGASGHLVLELARRRFPRSPVFVFTRSETERELARSLGAAWAGPIGAAPPAPLHAIIDTTPAWLPVVLALAVLEPGGRLVVNAIRKEERDRAALADLDYPRHLWLEKEVKTVANVTRADVREFVAEAAALALEPVVEAYPLADANRALMDLKRGRIRGAKVLVLEPRR